MAREYVERRDGELYIVGSRVPLHVTVYEYNNGSSVEDIRQSFPTLSFEQVDGALAFCHGNTLLVQESFQANDRDWRAFRAHHPAPTALREKLERTRQQLGCAG